MIQPVKKHSSGRIYTGGIILLLLAGIAVVVIFLNRRESVAAERELRATKLLAGPTVKVTKATFSKGGRTFTLIGEVRPFQSVTLYAKTSGYMEKIMVDKQISKPKTNGSFAWPGVWG